MKLVVPYIGELLDIDVRMMRLAEFLGISCETLALGNGAERTVLVNPTTKEQGACFVVNPRVMKEWLGLDGSPADLLTFLRSHFTNVLVHGLRAETFDNEIVATLSQDRLKSVDAIDGKCSVYSVANGSRHICEAFAGLSFGPVDPVNDHVFCTIGGDPAIEQLISIDGRPFMVLVKQEGTEILFVASEDVADLSAAVGDSPLTDYFSRLLPHAMALRYVAGNECWRPREAHASIIIDDPLLRKSYGFIDFGSLLRLSDQYNFHTTIAFIPHNFRRNSSRITRIFNENAHRLSICFHGNDHTGGEFASTDLDFLNTSLSVAEERMDLHQQTSGLPCDKIMVFPQGRFSVEAMQMVKSHNFYAAVNKITHPINQPNRLTIGELAQPAVLRYGGFPLFIRRPIQQTQSQDIAFNLFFGRPVLIGEHHDMFRSPGSLVEIANKINDVAPAIHWSNLGTVAVNSILTRRTPDGTHHVRAYSGTVQISNDSNFFRHYSIEWGEPSMGASIEGVLTDGTPCSGFVINDAGLQLSIGLAPGASQTLSVVYRNANTTMRNFGRRWNTQAFLRRRLSELRDNYLSKNQRLLTAAQAFQRRFLRV